MACLVLSELFVTNLLLFEHHQKKKKKKQKKKPCSLEDSFLDPVA